MNSSPRKSAPRNSRAPPRARPARDGTIQPLLLSGVRTGGCSTSGRFRVNARCLDYHCGVAARSDVWLRAAGALLAGLLLAGCGGTAPSPATTPAPGDGRPTNTLRWTTRRETGNVGFHVFRAESPDGPYIRVTNQPLPGAGTTGEERSYAWTDREIDPSRTYYYYVESLDSTGRQVRVTGALRARPKVPSRPTVTEAGPSAQ